MAQSKANIAWYNTSTTSPMIENFKNLNEFSRVHFFRKLPKDLLFVLFDSCDPVTAVCLSLTCKTFYDVYRYTKPALVPLTSRIQFSEEANQEELNELYSSCTQSEVQLYELIKDFMGPKYRWLKWNEGEIYELPGLDLPDNWIPAFPRFLNKDVYGDEERTDNYKEIALIGRWHDYNHSTICNYRFVSPKSRNYRACCHKTLPDPYNMGDAWYEKAKKVIWANRDLHDHEWSIAPLTKEGFSESLRFTSPEWYCWKTSAVFESENLLLDLENEFIDYKARQSTRLWWTVKIGRFLQRLFRILLDIAFQVELLLLPAALWLYSKMGLDLENDNYMYMCRLHGANKDGTLHDGTFYRAKAFVGV